MFGRDDLVVCVRSVTVKFRALTYAILNVSTLNNTELVRAEVSLAFVDINESVNHMNAMLRCLVRNVEDKS